jgi:hypothetical protein
MFSFTLCALIHPDQDLHQHWAMHSAHGSRVVVRVFDQAEQLLDERIG